MKTIWARSEKGLKSQRMERGSTLVEFALVLIVLMVMMFGIIDFARALYTYHFVANVAREGTRYAIVRGRELQPIFERLSGGIVKFDYAIYPGTRHRNRN